MPRYIFKCSACPTTISLPNEGNPRCLHSSPSQDEVDFIVDPNTRYRAYRMDYIGKTLYTEVRIPKDPQGPTGSQHGN